MAYISDVVISIVRVERKKQILFLKQLWTAFGKIFSPCLTR